MMTAMCHWNIPERTLPQIERRIKAMASEFVSESLEDFDEAVRRCVRSCQYFPQTSDLWRELNTIKADRGDFDRETGEILELPKPEARGDRQPEVKDPEAMRRKIAEMRANPDGFVAAETLIAMGEDLLRRAGHAV